MSDLSSVCTLRVRLSDLYMYSNILVYCCVIYLKCVQTEIILSFFSAWKLLKASWEVIRMSAPGACVNILNARSRTKGVGTVTNPESFLNQNYQELKQYCLAQRLRYIDEMFPPDRKSIGEGVFQPADLAKVTWLRPSVGLHADTHAHKKNIFGQHFLCCRNWFPTPLSLLKGCPGLTLAKAY